MNSSDFISFFEEDLQEAPLGFEPEGSASSTTPPFTETSGTPPYYKVGSRIRRFRPFFKDT